VISGILVMDMGKSKNKRDFLCCLIPEKS